MKSEIVIQLHSSIEYDRDVIHRLVDEGMKKIDSYVKPYEDKENAVVRFELSFKKNSDGSFYGNFHINIDGKTILYKRENFRDLADLVSHGFDHVKEQLSAK